LLILLLEQNILSLLVRKSYALFDEGILSLV
jgi:hypothetical protein